MLIILIIEFELRGPGPPGRTWTATTVYFYDKTKISKKNLRVDYYLLLRYCTRQCTLLSLPMPNHLLNLTPNYNISSVFRTQIVIKRRIEQFNFSIGFKCSKSISFLKWLKTRANCDPIALK